MNIAVIGSRKFQSPSFVRNVIFALLHKHPESTIVTDGAPGVGESVLDVTIDNDIKLYRCPLKEVSAWADAYVILYKPGDRKLDEWIMKAKQKRKPVWTIPVDREKIKKFPIPA